MNELIEWVVERWNAEVKDRPMINVHRRALDDTWRQVLRKLGADPRELLGPSHDELLPDHGGRNPTLVNYQRNDWNGRI